MKTIFAKENLPMTAVVALVVLAWLSFLSVIAANI
jgi:hypothetical protein